jgi:hypothetical protein
MKNYPHNVIRIKKGKPGESKVYKFISILNKKKQSSQKLNDKVGFYQYGKARSLIVKGMKLGRVLNKGHIFNKSAKKYFR